MDDMPPIEEEQKNKKELNKLTRFLCTACKLLVKNEIELPRGLKSWWKKHDKDDTLRSAEQLRGEQGGLGPADLLTHWDRVMRNTSSAHLHTLAEDLFDLVEDGELKVGATDVRYLAFVATALTESPEAANTAIRLMGMLAEEGFLPRDAVIAT